MLTEAQVAILKADCVARHDEAYRRLVDDTFRQMLHKHNFVSWAVHRDARLCLLCFTYNGDSARDRDRDMAAMAQEACLQTFLKATEHVYEREYEIMTKEASIELSKPTGLGNMCAKRSASSVAELPPIKKGRHATDEQRTLLLEYFRSGTINGERLMTKPDERSAYPQKDAGRPVQIGQRVNMDPEQVANWFVTERQRHVRMAVGAVHADGSPDDRTRQIYAAECRRLGLRGGAPKQGGPAGISPTGTPADEFFFRG